MTAGVVSAVVVALALGPSMQAAVVVTPAPVQVPLDDSVARFDLPQSSVTVFSVNDSVTVQSATSTSGGRTVLTVGTDVLFAFGSAKLRAGEQLRRRVKDVPRNARVTVVGYTDAVGSARSNVKLSRRRAEAVAAAVARARPDLRIRTEGRGETHPVAGNASAVDRARNRRVEVSWRN